MLKVIGMPTAGVGVPSPPLLLHSTRWELAQVFCHPSDYEINLNPVLSDSQTVEREEGAVDTWVEEGQQQLDSEE